MDLAANSLLVILVVGLVAGWIASKIVFGRGLGLLGNLLVGVVGAALAAILFPKLGVRLGTGMLSEIIYSALGAIILLVIVGLVRGRR
jgi:uncharacterized membrane protein YeaQ/YmgE (transglycosylase-associated protein family)